MVSAGLAMLLNKMNEKKVTIGVDGSVYRYHPHFHNLMMEKIRELVNPDIEVGLAQSRTFDVTNTISVYSHTPVFTSPRIWSLGDRSTSINIGCIVGVDYSHIYMNCDEQIPEGVKMFMPVFLNSFFI